MRTPVTLVLASPKSTAHHALSSRSVPKYVVLLPSFPSEAPLLRNFELMNAGLPSAMFTSVFTATHQMDDVNRSHLHIVSVNYVATKDINVLSYNIKGVSQVSVLGEPFFIVCKNDMLLITRTETTVDMYADDCAIISAGKTVLSIEQYINKDLQAISN